VPDPVQGNGINPSADIFVYDRALRTSRRVIDHTSGFDGAYQNWSTGLSSQVSPDGTLIAYGVAISRALGGTGAQTGNELNIADVATGVIICNPTIARGGTSDAFAAEFRGISFAPDGQSFVTPMYRYTGINDPLPIELPAIVRFVRNAGTGQWTLGAQLSTPHWERNPQTLLGAASIHTYPALSPNGTGLAFFSILNPDASTGTQPWTSRVVISNSDGTNPRLLTTFNPGFVPTGLTWSADGASLIVSVSQQAFVGTGYLPYPVRSNSAVFSVNTTDGTTTQMAELGTGLAPMLPATSGTVDLSNVRLQTTRTAGGLTLKADGVPADAMVKLEAADNSPTGFQQTQLISGAQLAAGFEVPMTGGSRFFRLAN
jgi:Tol biopolymer transport system component